MESKAQRAERLKREKNPWSGLAEIREFARQGHGSIPPEWLNTYFRWWGVYTQGDGKGVLGGAAGEGKGTQYFMLRVRVPNGVLTSNQARVIGRLAQKHARDLVDITVRQNFQFHWITIESLPEVLEELAAIGLTPLGACGDVVRNITGCPLAGLAHDEICDASPLVQEASRLLAGNSDFYNLPRKFKISISGCADWCSYPEINDVALTAVKRNGPAGEEVGFAIRVAGGLSTEPHLAVPLGVFIPWDKVVQVVHGVAVLFREASELRDNRERARMKYLFLKHGWTRELFLQKLEETLGFRLEPLAGEQRSDGTYRDHVGIHAQRQPGLAYVGASVISGRLTGDRLIAAAALAERYGDGSIRTTVTQNFVIANVPRARAQALADELELRGLPVFNSSFSRGAVACTGTEFCKLAITETKAFTRWLVTELDDRLPGFDQHLKLHVTGCPNSCGQHWIADIGIEGKKIKHNGAMVDAYYFCVGGAVGNDQRLARPVGYRCPAHDVPRSIERLLRAYLDEKSLHSGLRGFFASRTNAELRALLAGEEVPAATRDVPTAAAPAEVGG